MHCRKCGCPTYQDPCPLCRAKSTTAETTAIDPPSHTPRVAKTTSQIVAETYSLFHHLWTKHVGLDGYRKAEWTELGASISIMAAHLGVSWPPSAIPFSDEPTNPALIAPKDDSKKS